MEKETIIISLGGSLIIPNDIDTDFLKEFKSPADIVGLFCARDLKVTRSARDLKVTKRRREQEIFLSSFQLKPLNFQLTTHNL